MADELRNTAAVDERFRSPKAYQDREKFVAEARAWLGTPYLLGQMKKGLGCDCGSFILGVLQARGLAQGEELERHISDWFCHTKEEKYLRRLVKHASKVAEALSYATLDARPGDIVLTRSANSRVYNHGGIVDHWPILIHAVDPRVEFCSAINHELWCFREVAVFDPFVTSGFSSSNEGTKEEKC